MEGFGERAFSLLGPPAALSSARRVFSRTSSQYYSGVFRAVAR